MACGMRPWLSPQSCCPFPVSGKLGQIVLPGCGSFTIENLFPSGNSTGPVWKGPWGLRAVWCPPSPTSPVPQRGKLGWAGPGAVTKGGHSSAIPLAWGKGCHRAGPKGKAQGWRQPPRRPLPSYSRTAAGAIPDSQGEGTGLLRPGESLPMSLETPRPMEVPVEKPQNQPRTKKSIITFRLRINNTNNM